MVKTDMWVELIDETRDALATLRVEELEALAMRAEREFELAEDAGVAAIRSEESLRELATNHRMLREVLEATAGNLAVLQRMRNGEANSRWVR
jgi:hypothetical protein